MSDLSTLFAATLPPRIVSTPLQQSPPPSTLIPSQHKVGSPSFWNINHLESTLRKNIKESMDAQSFSLELQKITDAEKKQLFHTVLLFACCIVGVSYCMELDHRVIFHLLLVFIAQLLPTSVFKLTQEPIISKSLCILRPLIYATLCYYLSKNLAGEAMTAFNYPLTVLTLVMTSLNATANYFQPIYLLRTKHLFFYQLKQKSFLKKMSLFPVYFWEKIKFISSIKGFLLFSSLLTFILVGVVSIFLNASLLTIFQPLYLLLSLLIFFTLELFLEACRLSSVLFASELRSFKDKMPVPLSLLRMPPGSSFTVKVQRKCLESLYLRMQRVHCFLSTETCKSLLFQNYMDLFNSHVSKQLEELHSTMNQLRVEAEAHRRIYNESKGILQDLFIPFRKANALLCQFHCMVSVLASLSEVSTLIKVVILADEQAYKEKDPVRISPRVVELLEMVQSKIGRIQDSSTTKTMLISELQICERDLKGWVYSMKNGWV